MCALSVLWWPHSLFYCQQQKYVKSPAATQKFLSELTFSGGHVTQEKESDLANSGNLNIQCINSATCKGCGARRYHQDLNTTVLCRKEMDKAENCLFMHEGVMVAQPSGMLYFQSQFLIPELQNCKLKKTCCTVCIMSVLWVRGRFFW